MLVEKYKLKKIILLGLLGFAAIFLLVVLFGYLTKGQITIKTDSEDNYIRIENIDSSINPADDLGNKGKQLTKQVGPGTYMAYVSNSNGSGVVSRSITIKARQKITATLNPDVGAKSISAEPVYGAAAEGIVASSSVLSFVDLGKRKVVSISASGASYPFGDQQFKKVVWLSPNEGVAQDGNNSLFRIISGRSEKINLPFSVNSVKSVSFSVNKRGVLYVNNGREVWAGQTNGQLKKFFVAKSPSLDLFAKDNGLAIIETITGHDETTSVMVVSGSGKIISSKSIPARYISWSTNGKKFSVNSGGKIVIYDELFNQLAAVSAPLQPMVWRDDNSLYYGSKNRVMLFNSKGGSSLEVSRSQTGSVVGAMNLSENNDYIYFSSSYNEVGQLYRAKLKGGVVDVSILSLPVFLPAKIGVCDTNYINFIRPTIVIEYPGLTTPNSCVKTVRQELGYYGVDPDKFVFSVSQQNAISH